MELQNKQTNIAKEINVEITKIETKMSKIEPNTIEQVRFFTSKGNITFKPKVERSEQYMGLEKTYISPMTIEEFATYPKTVEIRNAIQRNGYANVIMDYSVMTGELEGETKTYRFINGLSVYDKIKVISGEVVTETKIE